MGKKNDFMDSHAIASRRDLFHCSAPKTHYCQNITLETDKLKFCTSKVLIIFVKNGMADEKETKESFTRGRPNIWLVKYLAT